MCGPRPVPDGAVMLFQLVYPASELAFGILQELQLLQCCVTGADGEDSLIQIEIEEILTFDHG